jgi:hypothetical protein
MLTVTLNDIRVRIRMLEARRGYADAAILQARTHHQCVLFTGELVGLDAGLKALRELEAFFDDMPGTVSAAAHSTGASDPGAT